VRDSSVIVRELEMLHPQPSLGLARDSHLAIQAHVDGVVRASMSEPIRRVRENVVTAGEQALLGIEARGLSWEID
jgi:hypothetical protein